MGPYLQLLRPKQWIKNSFVVAPLLVSGKFLELWSIVDTLIATVLFTIASSATYIINDIRDIEQDRKHPVKSLSRPLAAGTVSLRAAYIMLGLLYLALACGLLIMPAVVLVIVIYSLINLLYTFSLKHEPVVDIFIIAFGFVLRVYAGGVALDIPITSWMFVSTLCLALYLAAIKRRQEIAQSGDQSRKVLKKYSIALLDRYAEMSATCALVFYSLFVMSERPELVISIPVVLFGLYRYWYVVEVREMGESPTDTLFTDWQLQLAILTWAGIFMWAALAGLV